jgi:hypothetical protein
LAVSDVAAGQQEGLAEQAAVELAFAAKADRVRLVRAAVVLVLVEHTLAFPDVVVPSEVAFADAKQLAVVLAEQDDPGILPVQEGYLARTQGSFAPEHADVAYAGA